MGAKEFYTVGTNFFGNGAVEYLSGELRKRGAKRALIITDKFLMELGVSEKVGNALLNGNVEYATFYLVQPNPTVEVVNACVEAARALEVDWLVAVGGGSAIDTAKAVSIVMTNGGKTEDYEGINQSLHKGVPIVAVNTTAGTGSEVTSFYIVTDTSRHKKMCMVDQNAKVEIAVNDTQFMLDMPQSLTVATGMDALTHAIEAVFSKRATTFSDKDALWAIEEIMENLPKAYEDGHNEYAREQMAYAQYAAGVAFSNVGLGMVHAMAHSLGGVYNLPHGLCNALLLPFAMEFNGQYGQVDCQYRKIAKKMNLPGVETMSGERLVKEVVAKVRGLSQEIGLSMNLKELKVLQKDFKMLAEMALNDTCMSDNPVIPTLEQVIAVYEKAYKG